MVFNDCMYMFCFFLLLKKSFHRCLHMEQILCKVPEGVLGHVLLWDLLRMWRPVQTMATRYAILYNLILVSSLSNA